MTRGESRKLNRTLLRHFDSAHNTPAEVSPVAMVLDVFFFLLFFFLFVTMYTMSLVGLMLFFVSRQRMFRLAARTLPSRRHTAASVTMIWYYSVCCSVYVASLAVLTRANCVRERVCCRRNPLPVTLPRKPPLPRRSRRYFLECFNLHRLFYLFILSFSFLRQEKAPERSVDLLPEVVQKCFCACAVAVVFCMSNSKDWFRLCLLVSDGGQPWLANGRF